MKTQTKKRTYTPAEKANRNFTEDMKKLIMDNDGKHHEWVGTNEWVTASFVFTTSMIVNTHKDQNGSVQYSQWVHRDLNRANTSHWLQVASEQAHLKFLKKALGLAKKHMLIAKQTRNMDPNLSLAKIMLDQYVDSINYLQGRSIHNIPTELKHQSEMVHITELS